VEQFGLDGTWDGVEELAGCDEEKVSGTASVVVQALSHVFLRKDGLDGSARRSATVVTGTALAGCRSRAP